MPLDDTGEPPRVPPSVCAMSDLPWTLCVVKSLDTMIEALSQSNPSLTRGPAMPFSGGSDPARPVHHAEGRTEDGLGDGQVLFPTMRLLVDIVYCTRSQLILFLIDANAE
jgi:hypothetical protein